jgi:hypothetical protein
MSSAEPESRCWHNTPHFGCIYCFKAMERDLTLGAEAQAKGPSFGEMVMVVNNSLAAELAEAQATIEVLRFALELVVRVYNRESSMLERRDATKLARQALANLPEASTEYAKHARLGARIADPNDPLLEHAIENAISDFSTSAENTMSVRAVLTQGESNADSTD